MPLELWLPDKVRPQALDGVKWRCVVPTEEGPCGAKFYDGQERQYERHAAECAQKHAGIIRAIRDVQHPEIMRPWDSDLSAWIETHRDEILEGRKRI